MNPRDLDRLFDESAQRVGKKEPISNAYSFSPLASDHLLLKRSWEYFRARLAMIEEQWKKIFEAKDEKLKAIQQELDAEKIRNLELLEEKKTYQTMDDEFKTSKVNDFIAFKKNTEALRIQWEEERESFLKSQGTLEQTIDGLEKRLLENQARYQKAKSEWDRKGEEAKEKLSAQSEESRKRQDEWLLQTKLVNEENARLNTKIDLLRAEVERRDGAIQGLQELIKGLENEKEHVLKREQETKEALRKKIEELALLSERYLTLSNERDLIRDQLAREQSEWRELWERQRELHEKMKTPPHEDVDTN